MAEYASNGKGNLAVTLGAIGTALGAMNSDGCNNGILGGLIGNRNGGDCYVTEKEMALIQQNSGKDAIIAELQAEKYVDNKLAILDDKWQAKFDKLADKECNLEAALAMECERRACGDKTLLEYVNGHFVQAEKFIPGKSVNYGCVHPVLEVCPPCPPAPAKS